MLISWDSARQDVWCLQPNLTRNYCKYQNDCRYMIKISCNWRWKKKSLSQSFHNILFTPGHQTIWLNIFWSLSRDSGPMVWLYIHIIWKKENPKHFELLEIEHLALRIISNKHVKFLLPHNHKVKYFGGI